MKDMESLMGLFAFMMSEKDIIEKNTFIIYNFLSSIDDEEIFRTKNY